MDGTEMYSSSNQNFNYNEKAQIGSTDLARAVCGFLSVVSCDKSRQLFIDENVDLKGFNTLVEEGIMRTVDMDIEGLRLQDIVNDYIMIKHEIEKLIGDVLKEAPQLEVNTSDRPLRKLKMYTDHLLRSAHETSFQGQTDNDRGPGNSFGIAKNGTKLHLGSTKNIRNVQILSTELARAVCGYLGAVRCYQSRQSFIEENAHLKKFDILVQKGIIQDTVDMKIEGMSLEGIVNEYIMLKNEIEKLIEYVSKKAPALGVFEYDRPLRKFQILADHLFINAYPASVREPTEFDTGSAGSFSTPTNLRDFHYPEIIGTEKNSYITNVEYVLPNSANNDCGESTIDMVIASQSPIISVVRKKQSQPKKKRKYTRKTPQRPRKICKTTEDHTVCSTSDDKPSKIVKRKSMQKENIQKNQRGFNSRKCKKKQGNQRTNTVVQDMTNAVMQYRPTCNKKPFSIAKSNTFIALASNLKSYIDRVQITTHLPNANDLSTIQILCNFVASSIWWHDAEGLENSVSHILVHNPLSLLNVEQSIDSFNSFPEFNLIQTVLDDNTTFPDAIVYQTTTNHSKSAKRNGAENLYTRQENLKSNVAGLSNSSQLAVQLETGLETTENPLFQFEGAQAVELSCFEGLNFKSQADFDRSFINSTAISIDVSNDLMTDSDLYLSTLEHREVFDLENMEPTNLGLDVHLGQPSFNYGLSGGNNLNLTTTDDFYMYANEIPYQEQTMNSTTLPSVGMNADQYANITQPDLTTIKSVGDDKHFSTLKNPDHPGWTQKKTEVKRPIIEKNVGKKYHDESNTNNLTYCAFNDFRSIRLPMEEETRELFDSNDGCEDDHSNVNYEAMELPAVANKSEIPNPIPLEEIDPWTNFDLGEVYHELDTAPYSSPPAAGHSDFP